MKTLRAFAIVAVAFFSFVAMPVLLEAGRGRSSFGGSRSRSYSKPSSRPSSSFGGTRSTSPSTSGSSRYSSPSSSFGGTRSSASDYRTRYGTPRKSSNQTYSVNGRPTNYTVHSYGGLGDGFMAGYMMGSIPWMWSMPFHPAFYYSRPTVVTNPDGTTEVYPPTFSFFKLLMGILVVGGIAYLVYRVVRAVRGPKSIGASTSSSFS